MLKAVGAPPAGTFDLSTKGYVDTSVAGLPNKYQTTIGDGTTTTFTVTHNRGTLAVSVNIFSNEATPPTVTTTLTDINNVSFVFSRAPLSGSIQVVVIG